MKIYRFRIGWDLPYFWGHDVFYGLRVHYHTLSFGKLYITWRETWVIHQE